MSLLLLLLLLLLLFTARFYRTKTKPSDRIHERTDASGHDAFVVIRIDANPIAFQIKRKLTYFAMFQFVFVDVRPTPDARIHHVRKTLSCCHLRQRIVNKHFRLVSQSVINQSVTSRSGNCTNQDYDKVH